MKKGKSPKKSKVVDSELTPAQRSILANRIRMQILTIETDGLVLENMEGIKKLKIMLSLFESAGMEFETYVSLKEFDDRYLEVRLRTNRNRPSVVIIKHGAIPGAKAGTISPAKPVTKTFEIADARGKMDREKEKENDKEDEEVPDLVG